ncbi:hypothetical protein P7L53_15755 [Thermoleptolyngbya sichuanensis XZ-Cy5]|nr:hypothetical protein [Thermoleptolyngbya sichuanensis]MDG2617697.1 hypothetical protein [Thermoleptolyngbya sichuanensis XZ-Cy5]
MLRSDSFYPEQASAGDAERFGQLAQVTTVVSQFSPEMPNKKVSICNKSLPEGFLAERGNLASRAGQSGAGNWVNRLEGRALGRSPSAPAQAPARRGGVL